MKVFYVVTAVLSAAIVSINAAANGKAEIQEEHPIDWYDCSHKDDGNYLHPRDCTRFISCSGGIASQRDCATCHIDARRCPTGRLVYNATDDACLWADETTCGTDGGSGGGDGGSTEVTSGPSSTNAPTTPKPTNPVWPINGSECEPEECKNKGWCMIFWRCDKDSSKWVESKCGKDLMWNPRNPNGTDNIHGGNCDFFRNLDEDIKQQYWKGEGGPPDVKCLECFWREIEGTECNQEYEYQPANGTYQNILRLSCAKDLVFAPEKETCQRCEDVMRKDNVTSCC